MTDTTAQPDVIDYQVPEPGIARITLNDAKSRNAQSTHFLYALNDAFNRAARDNDVKVIVLAADGPHFSSGHDLTEADMFEHIKAYEPVGTWCGFGCDGAEAFMAREKELYLGLSERWRNIPKPTIAEVQGKVIAGGLMLAWPCDIIIAADNARFIDNTVAMGVCGAEFFNHPYEVGIRKAKEMLFSSSELNAADAHALGMVNHVVPLDDLTEFSMTMARRIAAQPAFALKLAKEALNTAQDNQGRLASMQTSFAYHQLSHANNQNLHNLPIDPGFLARFRQK